MRLVKVTWLDAQTLGEWVKVADLKDENVLCESAGWLVKESETHYFIAGTLSLEPGDDGVPHVNNVMQIARGMVEKIEDLSVKRGKRAPGSRKGTESPTCNMAPLRTPSPSE